jgi:hypothetical protein
MKLRYHHCYKPKFNILNGNECLLWFTTVWNLTLFILSIQRNAEASCNDSSSNYPIQNFVLDVYSESYLYLINILTNEGCKTKKDWKYVYSSNPASPSGLMSIGNTGLLLTENQQYCSYTLWQYTFPWAHLCTVLNIYIYVYTLWINGIMYHGFLHWVIFDTW